MIGLPRFALWSIAAVLLGLGTGMVYPTLLAAVADVTRRGGFRCWCLPAVEGWRPSRRGDAGRSACGPQVGIRSAIAAVGGLTFLSGAIVATPYGSKRTKLPMTYKTRNLLCRRPSEWRFDPRHLHLPRRQFGMPLQPPHTLRPNESVWTSKRFRAMIDSPEVSRESVDR